MPGSLCLASAGILILYQQAGQFAANLGGKSFGYISVRGSTSGWKAVGQGNVCPVFQCYGSDMEENIFTL